ncbi:hypothetical protein AB8O74_11590 [Lacticaseibacillus paracasei]|uniref:hypothetical protein n=1 Tax=Lacticaseibacillus paracasei TaxID=1597 RepID=UPI003594519A
MPNEKLDPWGKPIIDDEGDRNRVMNMLREKKKPQTVRNTNKTRNAKPKSQQDKSRPR